MTKPLAIRCRARGTKAKLRVAGELGWGEHLSTRHLEDRLERSARRSFVRSRTRHRGRPGNTIPSTISDPK